MGNYADLFDNMKDMMRHLKKKKYKANMEVFLEKYAPYFGGMTAHMDAAEDKQAAAGELADIFVKDVGGRFADKKGRIQSYVQLDLNLFMIYYVFPAILKTEHEQCRLIADTLCTRWGQYFKNSKIGYDDYETLYGAFREKIFGIF